ncbi:3' terminal RNA ribose 2'-O-methyltransferase Hen1 [uncultured Chitinophaga sp.]|uniref:3' terminal RNA ribose 2'-O-methyltransferase Hen1 n=1 Tax=uncultured Chitinophaga sp. TaxID=339340 RepID=UPI0025D86B13|nr:3' terminal RNA ribose 2'-O-methyltransferase Hen1 [uncultured Chitinophaga sp.]
MLLTITTTHKPATDLGYLLHKRPDKTQQVELSGGIAHVFYPEVSETRCTAALLLDIDPVGLVRKDNGPAGNDFALQQYVNDRPYVASSFMSAAIAKAYSSALNGRCKDRPELPATPMPFEIRLPVLPVRGGEALLNDLFLPLGYTIIATRLPLDEKFPAWGESRYFDVTLVNTVTMQQLLSHLYILIPVCDNDKHYWVGKEEVDKLMEKGKAWLDQHPAKELIVQRYLRHHKALISDAIQSLLKEELPEVEAEVVAPRMRAHDARLLMVKDELLATGAKSVADLGCGEGKLLRLLLPEKQFEKILGMDVSYRSLEITQRKLKIDRLPLSQQERIQLVQGSLTYRDKRIEGMDAAALVEVIEHLDEPRLATLEKVLFEYARPAHVIITTPNAEYNVKFESLFSGHMRHSDHRFEWTREQFRNWGDRLGNEYGYAVQYKAVGEEDAEIGALTQMAIFKKKE